MRVQAKDNYQMLIDYQLKNNSNDPNEKKNNQIIVGDTIIWISEQTDGQEWEKANKKPNMQDKTT